MTQTIATLSSRSRFGMREAGLWTSAAAIILAAHVAVAYAVQNLSFTDTADGGPPPALTVDMVPLVSAPPVPEDPDVLDTISPIPPNAAEETPVDPNPVTDPVADKAEPDADPPIEPDTAEQAEPTEQTLALSEQQP
ncbi:MAG: energy transducer TonB, partial [Mesorhizobium sp.]|nr:energy transducer TonB [Mesorhizobium sp.]